MKAFDVLLALHRLDMRQGQNYINCGYKLTILEGNLRPKSWYFCEFHKLPMLGEPSVVLTLGSDEKQYLYKVEK